MSGTDLRQRLVAVLAADAAGYSRLMAADDRATVAALDAARAVFRSQIEVNQGRVVDMAGDSVLAVFESATGAVTAALAVQAELSAHVTNAPEDRRMQFRIGVHLGDVIEKGDGTVYGDGVNIAARLQALGEVAGVVVSDAVRGAVKNRMAATFEDLGTQNVKNIDEPIRVFSLKMGAPAPTVLLRLTPEIDLSLPVKPSIAVLAFTNMNGDQEKEYFADGITEEIITELSRFHSLFVIARNSSFAYKGKSIDVRTVGKELGVRYVLEGSIRAVASRIRVTAQLIDATTGSHLWAEKYDRVLEDIFAVQEELTQSIVSAIAPQVDAEERAKARRRRPESLSAYDFALRASADSIEAFQKSDYELWERSLAQARQALKVDPRSLLALEVIAAQQARFVFMYVGDASEMQIRWSEAVSAASRLIELDPSGSIGYTWMGMLLSLAGRSNEALSNASRANTLNPNDVLALITLAYVDLMDGRADQALNHARHAFRISPRDPYHYVTNSICASACFLLREHQRGLEYALLSVGAAPNWPVAHGNHLMTAVGAGDIASARSALEAIRRLAPSQFIEYRLHGKTPYNKPKDAKRMNLAFRIAAGLEDPSAADALR